MICHELILQKFSTSSSGQVELDRSVRPKLFLYMPCQIYNGDYYAHYRSGQTGTEHQ